MRAARRRRQEGRIDRISIRRAVQFAEAAGSGEPPILYCTTDPISIERQRRVLLTQSPTEIYNSGRVAGLKYGCWNSSLTRRPPNALEPDPWQRIVHESMLTALKGGTNALFDRTAWLYANRAQRPNGCDLF
jgi:hypothetical protein